MLIFEALLILLLIVFNGFLALAEIAIVSARTALLKTRAERGDRAARVALDLSKNPSDFLSTIQVGITLIGIVAGAYGGATLTAWIAAQLERIVILRPYSQPIAFTTVILIITYLSLVLGELVPKRLALNNAETIATQVAVPMLWLSRISYPLVRFLSISTDFILKLLGARQLAESSVTEDEIKYLIEQGGRAGLFERTEQKMLERTFRLGDRRIDALMTPRTDITWLDVEDESDAMYQKIFSSGHARLPVAKGSLDNIIGVVNARDILVRRLKDEPVNLEALLQSPFIVPDSMPALAVLDRLRQSGQQFALIIDEFGGLKGLVTIVDILASVVDDLSLNGQGMELEAVQRADGSWLLDGMLPFDEFLSLFHINRMAALEPRRYGTLGGFVMDFIGRIPKPGDQFDWNGLHFEIMDMDGFRVDKVLISSKENTPSK